MKAEVIFYFGLVAFVTSSPTGQSSCIQGVTCELPDCFCASQNSPGHGASPGNLRSEEIPQMVVFSFDDAVNVLNYDHYEQLFPASRLNPNNCPISMTLFVWHNYTDYGMVRNLHNRGIEIASHSVTHRTPTEFWKTISQEDMLLEAGESKRLISSRAGIPAEEIRGWRAPYHQTGGDISIQVLQELGYEYDSSLVDTGTSGRTQQQWPFTLDFGYPLQCITPPCPTSSFKGFWEVPVVPISDRESIYPCTYIDGCYFQPKTIDEAVEILMKNFNINFKDRRQPLYINMHAWWFNEDFKLAAMDRFIDTILQYDDVYIVNFHQMLEWVRNPTPLAALDTFQPWQC